MILKFPKEKNVVYTFSFLLDKEKEMDVVLAIHDRYLFTPYVYPEQGWPEDDPLRQWISLTILVNIHAVIMYFALAGFSYVFLYDKEQMKHPFFLKVNSRREKE